MVDHKAVRVIPLSRFKGRRCQVSYSYRRVTRPLTLSVGRYSVTSFRVVGSGGITYLSTSGLECPLALHH